MTQLVLPQMKTRKQSVIVNIGSAAATVLPSGPLYAVYAGTKVSRQIVLMGARYEIMRAI